MGNKITIAVGLLGMAIGTLPLLVAAGVLPSGHRSPGQAPDWIGYLIGLMFFLAGLSVLIQSVAGGRRNSVGQPTAEPFALRGVYNVIGSLIAVSFATLFSWVAFGPGKRPFSVSAGPVGLFSDTSGSGDMIGRIAFGVAAVVFWFTAVRVVLYTARRLFSSR